MADVGVAMLKNFVVAMFVSAGAEFGFLTSEGDLRSKNYEISSVGNGGTLMRWVGLDLEASLPGLYGYNIFSPPLANWLGVQEVGGDNVRVVRDSRGNVSIEFGEWFNPAAQPEVLQAQSEVIARLGSSHFFDCKNPYKALEPPPWHELAGCW